MTASGGTSFISCLQMQHRRQMHCYLAPSQKVQGTGLAQTRSSTQQLQHWLQHGQRRQQRRRRHQLRSSQCVRVVVAMGGVVGEGGEDEGGEDEGVDKDVGQLQQVAGGFQRRTSSPS